MLNQLQQEFVKRGQPSLTKAFTVAFMLFNLMFILRLGALAILHLNDWSSANLSTVLVLIAFLMLLVFLAQRRIQWERLTDFLQRRWTIVAIFISFLVSAVVLDWTLATIEQLVRLEIWAWHFGVLLWAIFLWFAVQIRLATQFLRVSEISTTDAIVSLKLMKARRLAFVLMALLLASYWAFFTFIRSAPYHIHYDPEVAYLSNSLTPFTDRGMYAQRMDHPGTPLQLLGSVFYLLSYPLDLFHPQSIVDQSFLKPAFLHTMARTFLLATNLLVLIIVVKHVFQLKSWSSLFAALSVGLLFFVIHPGAIGFLTIWSPNSFNFIAGTLLLYGVFLGMRSNIRFNQQQLFLLGFLAGVVATFQLYLATWTIGLAITFFIYTRIQSQLGWRHSAASAAAFVRGSAFGFFASTLIILRHYPSFLWWIGILVRNQGTHGLGEPGLIDVEQLNAGLQMIETTALPLAIVSILIVVTIIALFIRLRRLVNQDYGLWSLAAGLIIQVVLLFLIIMRQPANHYLLSVAATLPILLAIIFELADRHLGLPSPVTLATLTIILVGLVFNLQQSFQGHAAKVLALDSQIQEVNRVRTWVNSKINEESGLPILVWTYGTHSQCYVWSFANSFDAFRFDPLLAERCPNDWRLNVWTGTVSNSTARSPLNEVTDWDAIITTQRWVEQVRRKLGQHPTTIDESFKELVIILNRK